GYITSGDEEQDPDDDLEEGSDGCIFNVDQTQTIQGSKRTIKGALAGNCTDSGGYKITLLNKEHFESITVNKTLISPVLIKGGAQNEEGNDILTVWGVNTSSARIITFLQGILTLQNIEFKYYQSSADPEDDQDETIWPWNAIIFAYDQSLSFKILSIDSCIFNGLGSQTPVRRMIYGYNVQKMNLTNCTFHDAYINDSYSVYCYSQNVYSEIFVNNTTFENINLTNSEYGVLYIDGLYLNIVINGSTFQNVSSGVYANFYGYNLVLIINGSTFENCGGNLSYSDSAALQIQSHSSASYNQIQYTITNNKFTNNVGYQTGGIYGEFRQNGIFNFSSNEFINNSKQYSENGANDAYLQWYNYPQDWNIDNAKYKVQKMFENCTPSNEKNVYYEFSVNNEFDISGYITSGDEEQDPDDDFEEGSDGCIFNVDQTQTIEGTKRTIKGALAGNCTDSNGYLITLLNKEHFESVTINKTQTFPVLIKGGAKDDEGNDILTVWGVNTSSARIITLLQGNLTLQNFEFKYYQSSADPEDDQDETIWPWNAIIFAYDEILSFRILSVDSCIFKGLGSQTPVRRMIYAYNVQKMNLTNCTFHDAYISDSYSVYCRSQSNSEIIVDNSTFENINLTNSGNGVLYIIIEGSNSVVTINGSTFQNVSRGVYIQISGSNSGMIINGSTFLNSNRGVYVSIYGYNSTMTINENTFQNCSQGDGAIYISPNQISSSNQIQYTITNNKFSNNRGQYSGGIYGYFYYGGIFNFSNNEFSNNSKQSGNGANDAYLRWNYYPQGWNIDNAKYKVLKMFENCTPSNEKNVYYEFRVNNDFEISGYITSGDEEQDPDDDLEEGSDGCIFNVDQTQTIQGSKRTIKG
ncbi:MAG: hypothetical protein EZS28_033616, partial [Streblomastix strix]